MEYEGGRWAFWLGCTWDTFGLGVEGELDRQMGDVTLRARLLWLRLYVSYTYDPDTLMLRELREWMNDLESRAFVKVRAEEYDALKADADKWRNPPVEALGREHAP